MASILRSVGAAGVARLLILATLVPVRAEGQAGVPGGARGDDYYLQYQMMVNAGVTKLMEDWEKACNNRNPAQLASLYLKDAMIVSGSGSIVTGPADIREYFEKNLPRLTGLRLGIHEIVASGDLAFLTGYLTYDVAYPSGGSYPGRVPYSMALWQQRDGSWRVRAQTGGDFPAIIIATDTLDGHLLAGTADSVRVRLTDAMGKPYRKEPVTFEVVYGGGAVLPAVAFTDTAGYAATEVTTAPQAGINTVLARTGVLPSEPLAFRTVTWSNQPVGQATPAPEPKPTPVSPARVATPVVVLDTSAVPAPIAIPGPELPPVGPLEFASRDTVVAGVSPDGRIAGRRPGETFIVVSNRAGRDSLLAVVADPDSPRLSAEFKGFTLPRDSLVSVRLALDVRPAQRLRALAFRFEFDTSVVRFRDYQADGKVPLGVVTTTAVAGSVGIVLSDPKTVTGRADLITLRFQTSSLAGRQGRLRLIPVDVTSISPKGDKSDRITAPSYPVMTRPGSAAYIETKPVRP
ncbi:MAG TPA: DUF4440 domain-containing protein [Gemmatimonadales bacterium]|nr:DUF4440 domain-containing protein [Gemmatimonadales bacterium]